MNIGHVGSILETQYQYANNSKRTDTANNFKSAIQKAVENQQVAGSETSKWAGDMVVPQPPNYSGFTYDSTISNKSKEEMTMNEYKEWFMNEMSKIPVSGWIRSTFSSGALVIKEEAFERMKNDPEYEKYVLNRIRSMYSVSSLPVGPNHVCYEVIGASPEECYGYAGPIGNNGTKTIDNEKSWWEKRNEKHEELLEEQLKIAQKRAQKNKVSAQQAYVSRQLAIQQRLQNSLMESLQSGNDMINIETLQTLGVSELTTALYGGMIQNFTLL